MSGLDGTQAEAVAANTLRAYRWQYIVSGAMEQRFQQALGALTSPAQMARIQDALAPLVENVGSAAAHGLH